MRVLVTGGTGFVGRHVLRELEQRGHTWFATYFRQPPDAVSAGTGRWFHLDNQQPDAWRHLLQQTQPEAILHLAGKAHVGRSWAERAAYFRVNALGTLFLMEALVELGLKPRVVLVGSAEIYGAVRPEENPIGEDRCPDPRTPYGASKACQELIGRQYAHAYGIPVIATRPFNHVGPGQRPGFVTTDFAQQIAAIEAGRRPPVLRVGNLEAVRDFTDVRDVARAYVLLLERATPPAVYNVCSGHGLRIRDLLTRMLDLARVAITVEVDPRKMRPVDLPVLIGDPSRIRAATGWQPRIPLDQTLSELLNEWRQKQLSTDDHQ